jgi:hypothetical protein
MSLVGSVDIVTNQGIRVQFQVCAGNFSPLQSVKIPPKVSPPCRGGGACATL